MPQVEITGWVYGFQKIKMTQVQAHMLDIPLRMSKENVDSILDDKVVILDISDIQLANEFVEQATKLGARARVK